MWVRRINILIWSACGQRNGLCIGPKRHMRKDLTNKHWKVAWWHRIWSNSITQAMDTRVLEANTRRDRFVIEICGVELMRHTCAETTFSTLYADYQLFWRSWKIIMIITHTHTHKRYNLLYIHNHTHTARSVCYHSMCLSLNTYVLCAICVCL